MGIEKKDGDLKERSLEEAEPGELVRSPTGEMLPKAGRDKSGRGISGMRPKPNLSRGVPSEARQRGFFRVASDGGLEKIGDGAKRNLGRVLNWPDEDEVNADSQAVAAPDSTESFASPQQVASLEDALAELDQQDDQLDDVPTRPDRPIPAEVQQMIDDLPDSSILRPTIMVEVEEEPATPVPAVVIPPLGDISKFEDDWKAADEEARLRVTIPDIGVIRFGAREEIARLNALIEVVRQERAKYLRADGSIFVPDEDLQKKNAAPHKLDANERTLIFLQQSRNYLVAWWKSNNALVRLWGQLDCAGQVFDDERIITDLMEVLGEGATVENHRGEIVEVQADINFYRTHQAGIRAEIRKKYPKANLDAIIATQE